MFKYAPHVCQFSWDRSSIRLKVGLYFWAELTTSYIQILILQMFKNLTKPEKEFMKLVLHFLFFFHLVWFRLFFFALKYNRNISQPVDCLIIRGISRLYQSVTNIFEYIGHKYIFWHSFVSIFLLWIYSDIHSYQVCLYEYIRTLVRQCVKSVKTRRIFEYSYNFQDEYLFWHSFKSNFLIQIYSDIRSYKNTGWFFTYC